MFLGRRSEGKRAGNDAAHREIRCIRGRRVAGGCLSKNIVSHDFLLEKLN